MNDRESNVLVTILTPTLNATRHLSRCLKSLREQTWPREQTQHLVLDGGSTDDTVATARAAGAEVDVEKDSSLYQAMNRGIRLARGDVIGWLNSDDTFEPGAVARVARAFRKDPQVDVVVGDCRIAYPGWIYVHRGRATSLEAMRNGARSDQWVNPLATWFRTDALRRLGPYDLRYRVAADRDLWLRAAMHEPPLRVRHAGGILGTFFVHADSLSGGRETERSANELAGVFREWKDAPNVPPGIRRHALFMYRCLMFERAAWRESGSAPGCRVSNALREVKRLRETGEGVFWDVRGQIRRLARELASHYAKALLGIEDL
jgi:glycosyltransferase involved in cell wall biosynthesis